MNTDLIKRLRRIADELSGVADHAEVAGHSSDDPTKRAQRLVEQFVAAVADGNLDGLDAVVDPDVVYVVSGRSRASGVYEGLEALKRSFTIAPRAGASGLQSRLVGLIADADAVVTFHEITGSLDGDDVRFETALRYRVGDGRIAEIHEFSGDQHRCDDVFA
jgi:ketosteroid isomerase-like protein